MTDSQNIARIVGDPDWLPHRYDPGHDAVHFVLATREERARATFLTDEYLKSGAAPIVVVRGNATASAPAPAPVHYIFHSAFCCSTLLARAFDLPGVATSLKEPPIFNDLVGWRHGSPVEGKRVAAVLDGVLALLARPFEKSEAVVVKPSNVALGLADAMLAMRPGARAVFLHAPLPVYLRSIAKKGVDGRLWVRDLLAKLLRERLVNLGLEGEDYLRLTDLQAAAIGWLAQHALFAQLVLRYGDRVRTLDSETLIERPEEAISALAALFGLAIDPRTIQSVVDGPAFRNHSKHGAAFDAAARDSEYSAAAGAHADEIAKVEVWAEAVARTAGVAMTLPGPLLTAVTERAA